MEGDLTRRGVHSSQRWPTATLATILPTSSTRSAIVAGEWPLQGLNATIYINKARAAPVPPRVRPPTSFSASRDGCGGGGLG